MSLRLRLHWFNKKTEIGEGHEYSSDFSDNRSIIEQLGLSVAHNINNGYFDVEKHWIPMLQPLFYHWINLENYDYQVAFDYKDRWNIKDNSKKGHDMITEQFISIDELVGIPLPYPLAEPPKGWFSCHGQPFDKEKYPKLAKCYPDGKLPDLRGEFIRGWDNNRGEDKDRNLLTEQNATFLRTGIMDYNGTDANNSSVYLGMAYSESDSAKTSIDPPKGIFKAPNNSDLTHPSLKDNGATGNANHEVFASAGSVWVSMRPRNVAFNYIVKAA